MKKNLTSPLFLIYLFILFFLITNVFIISNFSTSELFDGFIMIYVFWLICIILFKIISNKLNFKKG